MSAKSKLLIQFSRIAKLRANGEMGESTYGILLDSIVSQLRQLGVR